MMNTKSATRVPTNISPHFQREGSFFVDHRFNKRFRGQDILELSGKRFFRFMDFFYIPKPIISLTPSEIIELCELRNKYFHFVVDEHLNGEIVACMANYLRHALKTKAGRNVRALDFGCGAGASSCMIIENLSKIDLYGVDISSKAVSDAQKSGLKASWLGLNDPMQFPDQFFDAVFAVFVMHFNVNFQSLQNIHRVLKQAGPFIFNCYKNEPPSMRRFLSSAGFSRIERLPCVQLKEGHFIYACYKT